MSTNETIVKIIGWLPVLKPIKMPNLFYSEDYNERIQEFSVDLCKVLPLLDSKIKCVKTSVINVPNREVLRNLKNVNKFSFDKRDVKFIKIECWYEFNKELFQQLNPKENISTFFSNLPYFASDFFGSVLRDSMIIVELAFPGRFNYHTGCCYWKRRKMGEISSFHGIYREALDNKNFKWPEVQTLSFIKVSQWIKKIGLFDQGVSRSPIQRALASFTHLFSPRDSENLFWAMQGLEAFYCKGNGDLRRQLSEKSRLFLGEWNQMKNIVGSLYDFRSKFVHGSFNLERWNNDRMYDHEDEKDREDLYKATMLAIRILLSTLQKCAVQEITDVKFDYSMIIEK